MKHTFIEYLNLFQWKEMHTISIQQNKNLGSSSYQLPGSHSIRKTNRGGYLRYNYDYNPCQALCHCQLRRSSRSAEEREMIDLCEQQPPDTTLLMGVFPSQETNNHEWEEHPVSDKSDKNVSFCRRRICDFAKASTPMCMKNSYT